MLLILNEFASQKANMIAMEVQLAEIKTTLPKTTNRLNHFISDCYA